MGLRAPPDVTVTFPTPGLWSFPALGSPMPCEGISKAFAPAGQVLPCQDGEQLCHCCFDSPQIPQIWRQKYTPVVFFHQRSYSPHKEFPNHLDQQEFWSVFIKTRNFSTAEERKGKTNTFPSNPKFCSTEVRTDFSLRLSCLLPPDIIDQMQTRAVLPFSLLMCLLLTRRCSVYWSLHRIKPIYDLSLCLHPDGVAFVPLCCSKTKQRIFPIY